MTLFRFACADDDEGFINTGPWRCWMAMWRDKRVSSRHDLRSESKKREFLQFEIPPTSIKFPSNNKRNEKSQTSLQKYICTYVIIF